MLLLYISVLSDGERRISGLLYSEHKLTMFRAAYAILKDCYLAEDAVHNAFENVSGHLDQLSDIKSTGTASYLIITVQNAAKKIYNKRKPLQDSVDVQDKMYELRNATDTEDKLIDGFSKELISKCLKQMDPQYSTVLIMKYYLQKDNQKIAKALGLSQGAVRKRLERARKDFIKRYRGENGEE